METTEALVWGQPWNWNTSSFWTFNRSCKFACFL